ncbi:ATP-dependent RNA helicase-like protein chl1 [Mytilinidion resinicola]|uniref:ATP-dependent DNA helicase CHL1 n=1 Tax=Mytilinidion resinicola TaxID=574789 RepID=A0A6A6YFX5_9PEZI|nr:ATP-dependent RNA helicase-like protein chl1 [Mytilinidion resinicola]KAF2807702.1 ATP-dependent RNA helicase-like protein chl1 [Mytilinidion resinicola]
MAQRDFHHPYQPYEIQNEFMNALYDCIESGKVGIFESPTGTGKSLSLICGSLTWLRDHKRKTFQEGLNEIEDDDEPEWMNEYARREKKQAALRHRADFESRLEKIRAREKKTKEKYKKGEPHAKRQKVAATATDEDAGEAQFLLDDYESEEESNTKFHDDSHYTGLSAETRALLEQINPSLRDQDNATDDFPDELKIFYCSRTHSQLTQFSSELKRVKMPPAIDPDDGLVTNHSGDNPSILSEEFKHLTLGSRKNLCINPKVKNLGSAIAINERCLDLQKSGVSAERKCSFLPTKETEAVVNDFRDHALAKIRDIEDLGVLGKKLGICPYYASRPAIKPCEIVTLPYPLLLQKSAREALDISLAGHVIIIDEAHNLMDAVAAINSITVSLAQLRRSREQLTVYLRKFQNKLRGKNRVYVTQTVRLLDSLIHYLLGKNANAELDGIANIGDLMAGKGVDQIDLFKLTHYLQESKLARKVDGYIAHVETHQEPAGDKQAQPSTNHLPGTKDAVPTLTHLQNFFLVLTNPSKEGQFFFSKEASPDSVSLKYMLLDPTMHFKEIVDEARAVILAGGTMSPMEDYSRQLFSYVDPSRVMTLSCGHVIPPSQLLACPIIYGPENSPFDFTFGKRESDKTLLNLGLSLLSFIQHIPDGVVVFFPSYAYLDKCVAAWKRLKQPSKPGSESSFIWNALDATKPVFMEQRSQTHSASKPTVVQNATVDSVLSAYSNAVAAGNGRGALLLSVIGGSLSEGINFSDALGRGVVVVGLPFPNPHTAEWKAKMAYIKSKAASWGQNGDVAVREFYENICMRAVNQCVGRAIRHLGDYAVILMLDRRYGEKRIQSKLPGWIRGSLLLTTPMGELTGKLDRFFESQK